MQRRTRHALEIQPADEDLRSKRRDRAVLRGFVATAATRVLAVVASFFALGIASRVLTTAEFGFVTILVSVWLILTMFDLGVGGALTTRVARSHARENAAEIRGHVDQALVALTLIGGLVAVAGTISAVTLPWRDWIGGELPQSTVVRSLILTFVASGAALPAAVGPAALSAMQRFAAAKACIAASGMATVISAAAVAPFGPSPEVFILVMLSCPVLVTMTMTAWVRLRTLRTEVSQEPRHTEPFKEWLLASGWFALYTFANTIGIGSGTIIVGAALGPADAGMFSVATRLCSPIITVVAASAALLRPGLTEAISRGDLAWAKSRYRRGIVGVFLISSAMGIALIVGGPWLAKLWIGSDLTPTRSLFAWTVAFSTSVAVATAAGVVVMAVERLRAPATLAACAAAISVSASVFLATTIGVNGAAIGAMVGSLGVLLPGLALIARAVLRSLEPTPTPGGEPDTDADFSPVDGGADARR